MFNYGDRVKVKKGYPYAEFVGREGIVIPNTARFSFRDHSLVLLDESVDFAGRDSREWSFENHRLTGIELPTLTDIQITYEVD